MFIDIGALVLVLLFGLFGYLSGFFVQAVRLGALIAAFFAARTLAEPFGAFASNGLGVSPVLANVGAFLIVFFLVWITVGLLGGAIARKMRESNVGLSVIDRGLGGVLGAAKGALLVYVALASFAAFRPAIAGHVPDLDRQFGASVVGREVLRHNLIQDEVVPRARALARIAKVLQNPLLLQDAQQDPKFRALLEHPKGKFLQEPAIQQAILDGHWEVLWSDGRVFEFFSDLEVVELLNGIELEEDKAKGEGASPKPEPSPFEVVE